ncbi:MAG: hypothetical protein ACHQ6T_18365 [Myxococcota bacterium]
MNPTIALSAVLLAICSAACSSMEQFETKADYDRYVAGLHLYGITAQAATAEVSREGFACHPTSNVIQGAPNEVVVVCTRHASSLRCSQEQSIVFRLDWIGEPKPEAAAGMRVNSVGSAAGEQTC